MMRNKQRASTLDRFAQYRRADSGGGSAHGSALSGVSGASSRDEFGSFSTRASEDDESGTGGGRGEDESSEYNSQVYDQQRYQQQQQGKYAIRHHQQQQEKPPQLPPQSRAPSQSPPQYQSRHQQPMMGHEECPPSPASSTSSRRSQSRRLRTSTTNSSMSRSSMNSSRRDVDSRRSGGYGGNAPSEGGSSISLGSASQSYNRRGHDNSSSYAGSSMHSSSHWNIPSRDATAPDYEDNYEQQDEDLSQSKKMVQEVDRYGHPLMGGYEVGNSGGKGGGGGTPSIVSGLSIEDDGTQVNFPEGGRQPSFRGKKQMFAMSNAVKHQPDPFATLNSGTASDDDSDDRDHHARRGGGGGGGGRMASEDGSFYEYFPTNRDSYRADGDGNAGPGAKANRRSSNGDDIVSRPWRKHMAQHQSQTNDDGMDGEDVRSRGNEKSEIMSFAGTDFSPTPYGNDDDNNNNRRITMGMGGNSFRNDEGFMNISANFGLSSSMPSSSDDNNIMGGVTSLSQSDPSVVNNVLPLESQQALEALVFDRKLREEKQTQQENGVDEDLDDGTPSLDSGSEHSRQHKEVQDLLGMDDLEEGGENGRPDADAKHRRLSTSSDSTDLEGSIDANKNNNDNGDDKKPSAVISNKPPLSDSESDDEDSKGDDAAARNAALMGFGAVTALDTLNRGKDGPIQAETNAAEDDEGDGATMHDEENTVQDSMAGTLTSMSIGTSTVNKSTHTHNRPGMNSVMPSMGNFDLSFASEDGPKGTDDTSVSKENMTASERHAAALGARAGRGNRSGGGNRGENGDSDVLFDFEVQPKKPSGVSGICADPCIVQYKWWLILAAILGLGALGGLSAGYALLIRSNKSTQDAGTTPSAVSWEQMGDPLYGEAANDLFGTSIAQSDTGKVIAVGSSRSSGATGEDINAGSVRVFSYATNDASWSPVGEPIYGMAGDMAGQSVSMSRDGLTVSVGFPSYTGFQGFRSGKVTVYKHDNGNWALLGDTIDGEAAGDEAGYAIALNGDGTRVAVPAWLSASCGERCGSARVFELKDAGSPSERWEQIGNTMTGDNAYDLFGVSAAISRNGSRLAVGAPQVQQSDRQTGYVKVFEYQSDTGLWEQLGSNIEGAQPNSWYGRSLSLSDEGDMVVVGASNYGNKNGRVAVYKHNAEENQWKQMGQILTGPVDSMFGVSVSISGDGTMIVVGGDHFTGQGPAEKGAAQAYTFDGTSWLEYGPSLLGTQYGERTGNSVSISKDGRVVAAGGYGFNLNDGETNEMSNAGQVRVFSSTTSNPSAETERTDR